LEEENSILLVSFDPAERNAKAMFGLYRALIANMVQGVSQKFTKNMEMIGVGYRARVEGKDLVLLVGKSHDVIMPIPEGLEVTVTDNTKIQVTGINNEVVGQFCANIRKERPPEPYKGKGIRFAGETVLIKDGKK
jgi:large subunit ribosomal protein L6